MWDEQDTQDIQSQETFLLAFATAAYHPNTDSFFSEKEVR